MLVERHTGSPGAPAIGRIKTAEAVRYQTFSNRTQRNVRGIGPQLMVEHASDRVTAALIATAVTQYCIHLACIIRCVEWPVIVLNLRCGQQPALIQVP